MLGWIMHTSEISRRVGAMKNLLALIEQDYSDWRLYNDYFLVLKSLPSCDRKWLYSGKLKDVVGLALGKGVGISDKLGQLFKEVLLMEARGLRFDSYMQYIELNREPEKRFWLPRRKQLLSVAESIQDLIDDKLDILCISLPPGTGKSTLEIFLLSMLIGAIPDKPNLASGHSSMMTGSIYEGVLTILQDPVEYLWQEVFPDRLEIITNAKEQTIDISKKHRFSSLTCRAIDASLTGATRYEGVLCADDLVSGIEEAMSIERLNTLWGKYTNNLKSRAKQGGKELHLATRWSVHDVIGRLERQYANNNRARFIVVPALNEKGESNFEYEYGVGFDTAFFENMRRSLDDASFKALYMNQPIEREGTLYRVDEIRVFFELPEGEPDAIIAICDTKDRGDDYSFLPVAYVYGKDYYLVDCICDNGLPNQVDARLAEILLTHQVQMARFESNAAGGRIAEKVQKEVKENHGITHITTKHTQSNKETRIIVNSAWVKENCLFWHESPNKDYDTMKIFLFSYTVSGKNKNDDVPDGLAMLADFAQTLSGQKAQIFKRVF